MSRAFLWTAAAVLLGQLAAAPAARADPLKEFLLAAFAAEQQASHKRTELTYRRGLEETHYVIERILPDRLRVVTRGRSGEQEVLVIGSRMYQRSNGIWRATSAPVPVELLPSTVDLFRNALDALTELGRGRRNGVSLRSLQGTVTWTSAVSRNSGTIRVTVEAASKLPRRMSFKGMCGGIPCSFEQTFAYSKAISIEPPV